MTDTKIHARRTAMPRAAALAVLLVLMLVPVSLSAPASAAPVPKKAPPLPAVQAFDGDTPLPSPARIREHCAKHRDDCRFTIDAAASGEYYSAVKSFGNAVVNCTRDPIRVDRQIVLRTGSTDNLGGDITGKLAVEGQINASGEVSAGVDAKGKGEFVTPNKQQGPHATVGAEAGVSGSGKVGGSLGVKAAFEGAFKLSYQRSWTTEQTETTTYSTTVRSGEALAFGASAAMQRIAGTLTTGTGLSARNVVVDGPSTVNNSTFMADTFAVPASVCDRAGTKGKSDVEVNAEAAERIAARQEANQAAAQQTGKDIKAVGSKIAECPAGNAACMEKLAGKGEREEAGIKGMADTITAFRPEPADNGTAAVTTTCANFPGSLPGGAAEQGQAPFPATQLCSHLGS
ncbi:hypothetical protein [Streptomyces sp. WM6372]|uniref:hypothetical protein n=1 Tax=Streptomyces sp. WM6372 TaxID=1415555 RepID=UPI0006B05D42|nr:hypothetical protein [Streptomyces sp. WM6372]